MPKEAIVGNPEWARFEDWITNILGKYQYWTVVAEIESHSGLREKEFSEKKATLSYLAKNKRESVRKALESDGWDVQYDHGGINLQETDLGIICHEDLGDDASRVFVTLQDEIGGFPATWKLWPTFENYFNLRYDENRNLIDPHNGEVVVEIPFPAEKGQVRVRTDYLQDYLAARQMVLIRQHDHMRDWINPIKGIAEHEGGRTIHKEKWGCYSLYLVNAEKSDTGNYSRLGAKDIVTPYQRAGSVGHHRGKRVRTEDCPEFITSKEIDGKEVRQRPNPDDILYPTYFHPKVLKKYYDEPSKYSVGFHSPGMGGVSFLNKWNISIGRNREGLIVLWLGDLIKKGLSYEEIVHWRAHNVPPRGGMAMDFWNTQMQCEPSEIPSLESRLIDSRYIIVKAINTKRKQIYLPYSGPDKYTENILRTPLFDEHTEFQETILILSRMFIEYLDINGMRDSLPDKYKNDNDGKPLSAITVFSNWLEVVIGIAPDVVKAVKQAFQRIQMVRSKTGAAHRFSDSSYKHVISKLGISGQITAETIFSAVAELLASTLEKLCAELGVENSLWWIKLAKKKIADNK